MVLSNAMPFVFYCQNDIQKFFFFYKYHIINELRVKKRQVSVWRYIKVYKNLFFDKKRKTMSQE